MSNPVEVKVYSKHYKMVHGTKGAAGWDLCAVGDHTLGKGEVHVIRTGVHVELPEGCVGEVVMRSSYAKKGLILTNAPGQIDSDYRGEIMLLCCNVSNAPVEVPAAHRIAQLLIKKTETIDVTYVDDLKDLSKTERGTGGFGSTGSK